MSSDGGRKPRQNYERLWENRNVTYLGCTKEAISVAQGNRPRGRGNGKVSYIHGCFARAEDYDLGVFAKLCSSLEF